MEKIKTLAALKKSSYKPKTVKQELRENLIKKLEKGETAFPGIIGFQDSVLPDVERAILSQHNILFLGLRGQAKTRIARLLVGLLDEYIPVVKGSELNDDPLNPISRYAHDLISEHGDDTPIEWLHRNQRYVEKLATPDVSIADLVGDVDPIKAATLKLPYSDERVIHFGLIPRAHRSIFVINELPDLQARIQVSLFNILQEGDMQIRGFKIRLPLEIQFLFTANPEDYTNRGSIITPLKDRIESQILTHYPSTVDESLAISRQEARTIDGQDKRIDFPETMERLVEEISFEARDSDFIDEKSGVSARLSISARENLLSAAERRVFLNKEKKTMIRIGDLMGIVPAITGKLELVYEGEQMGPKAVAVQLMGQAIKKTFQVYFPHPERLAEGERDPYGVIRTWFSAGNQIDLELDAKDSKYKKQLESVAGLEKLVLGSKSPKGQKHLFMELVLHGLAEYEILNREVIGNQVIIADLLADMFNDFDDN